MNKMKKMLTLLLILSMIVSGFAVFSFAEDTNDEVSGNITEDTEAIAEEAESDVQPEEPAVFDDNDQVPAADETADEADAEEAVTEEITVDEELPEEVEELLESKGVRPARILSHSQIASNTTLGINGTVDARLTAAGYRTILVLGIDNGRRADIQLLLVLKKNKNGGYDGKVFSIPRDTYVEILDANNQAYVTNGNDRRYARVNIAYQQGGTLIAMKTLNRNFDLNIKECIAVDWQCAADMITALNKTAEGTITNKSMLEEINDYIRAGKHTTAVSAPAKYPAKVALLGWQAVEYLRVRKYSNGSTIIREARNRTMFRYLFGVAKRKSPDQRKKVLYELTDELDTNMGEDSLAEIDSISAVNDAGSYPTKTKTLFDPAGRHTVRVPNTLATNVKTLHKKIYPGVKYGISSTVNSISKQIVKRSKKVLKKKGSLAYASVSAGSAVTYNGKAQNPNLSLTVSGYKLYEKQDYTISVKNNVNVGKATYTLKGQGAYAGSSKSGSFVINPIGTSLESLTAGKKSFTVNWKAQTEKMSSSYVTGYQIQYSLNSSFKKGNKSATVKGYSKTAATVKKLKSKKTYYVRIRTYMKVGKKKTYYSGWSEAQKVVTN